MRRPTRIVAWGLAASVAAAALGALVYGPGSQRPANPVETNPLEEALPLETRSIDTARESHPEPNQATAVQAEARDTPAVEPRTARKRAPPDEATVRESTRKSATEDVQLSYSLLFEDLGLSPRETEDLTALLIEIQIEGTWHTYQRGRTVGAQERFDRIVAAIGNEKTDQFLALEKNVGAYWETAQIASLLRRHGVPLDEAQREGVFEILVEVRHRYQTPPPAGLDPHSLERVEHTLWQLDEIDRHIIELAPSALSPNQVVYLFRAYEAMSRDRVAAIERQKKGRAERPDRYPAWAYPGRWSSYALRSAGL